MTQRIHLTHTISVKRIIIYPFFSNFFLVLESEAAELKKLDDVLNILEAEISSLSK